jgi:hypothetical protein
MGGDKGDGAHLLFNTNSRQKKILPIGLVVDLQSA